MSAETVEVDIAADGDSDMIEVPRALIDVLSEGNEPAATVIGDIAMLGIAQQAHGVVHHGHGEVDSAVEEAESLAMDLFEERFGRSFGEMTGHDH
ncbi:MAG: hypothetical protein ABEH64_08070 [Salinirussus sp.]